MTANILEFWNDAVLPVAAGRIDTLFPDFDWRPRGRKFEAGRHCAPWCCELFGVNTASRIYYDPKEPGMIAAAGALKGIPLTSIYRQTAAVLKGKEWVDAVLGIARELGVDTAPVEREPATPEEKARWAAEHAKAQELAAKRRARQEEQARRDRADKINQARKIVAEVAARATDPDQPEDQGVIRRYLKARGRSDAFLDDFLPRCNAYFGRLSCLKKQVTAVVLPVIHLHDGVVAYHRLFVDRLGKKQLVQVNEHEDALAKASWGPVAGGAIRIGEGLPSGVLVLTEGWETGVAVHEATGWTVWACLSTSGLRNLVLPDDAKGRVQTVVIAADLDGEKTRAGKPYFPGQEHAEKAAERIRELYGVPVAVALPKHAEFGHLVGPDGLPADGRKGVDWEDCVNHAGPVLVRNALYAARATARGPAPKPASADPARSPHPGEPVRGGQAAGGHGSSGEPPIPPRGPSAGGGDGGGGEEPPFGPEHPEFDHDDVNHWLRGQAEGGVPSYRRRRVKDDKGYVREPFGPIVPRSDLEKAHTYLLARWAPPSVSHAGGGLRLCVLNGERLYRWTGLRWVEEGGTAVEYLRGDIRRFYEDHCEAKKTRENPPALNFVDANLSMTALNAIAQCVIDEINIITPRDEFTAQFFIRPNVRARPDGTLFVVQDHRANDRCLTDGADLGLPGPDHLLPIRNGLLDLERFQADKRLIVHPHTPLFFNRGASEIELPVADAAEAFDADGLPGLVAYARSLCPEWIKFLGVTFAHPDHRAVPATTREIHKVLGAILSGRIFDFQMALIWLVGSPGNGKSLFGEVFEAIIGPSNTVSSTTTALMNRFHLKSWIGKRLARFPDMDVSGRLDKKALVELLKLLAARDPVGIDRKNLDELSGIRLSAAMLISANTVPNMPDPTLALMRRSLCFHFRNPVKAEDRDHTLRERLCSPGSLAGVLLLGLCGLLDLAADKRFVQPSWSDGPMEDLRAELSPYDEFIDQCIQILPANDPGWLANTDIRKAMVAYMQREGRDYTPPMSTLIKELKIMLEAKGWSSCKKTQHGGVDGYQGLRLTPVGEQLLVAEASSQQPQTEDNSFLPV